MDKKQVYCRYCGKLIDEDAPFCTYCGKKQGVYSANKTIFHLCMAKYKLKDSQFQTTLIKR